MPRNVYDTRADISSRTNCARIVSASVHRMPVIYRLSRNDSLADRPNEISLDDIVRYREQRE
jgi:hypothetical protein